MLLEGTAYSTLTNDQGVFRFEHLPAGRYSLAIVAYGYERGAREDVSVETGGTVRVSVALERAVIAIPDLVVTASRSTQRPGDVPVSIAVITGEELFRRNVISIEEALPFAQGVAFNANQMDIRGSTGLARGVGSRVLMLLDGHRVMGGVSQDIQFGALPVMGVDRIEVVKGPHSALYGSNALGGVVNLITARPSERPETTIKLHYGRYDTPSDATFTDESLSMQGLNVQHSRWIGQVGTTLMLGRETSDGYHQNGDYGRWKVRAKGVFPKDSDRPWEAFVNWSREDAGEFFTWLSDERPLEVDPEELGDWTRQDDLALGVTANVLSARSPVQLQIKPQLFYNSVENYFHDSDDFHKSTRLATDAMLSMNPTAGQALALGGEIAWTDVASNLVGDPTIWDGALYAQDEIVFNRKVQANVGLRLDYHSAQTAETETNLSPKLGLVYKPSDGLSFRTSVSRGYRAPSASEQFTNTIQFGFRVIPNPELTGETAWSAEVGVTGSPTRWLWLDGSFFHSEYSGLIEPSQAPGEFFVFQFRNVADARVTGFDTGLKAGLANEMLTAEVNYMFIDSEDERTGDALPYRSKHNLTSTVSTLRGAIAVDFRYRSAVEEVLAYPLDPRGDITVVDLRFSYELAGVGLLARVSNLFQARYVNVQERFPGASRRFLLTVVPRF